jgi:polyisoprenoid-binding protein YceI
MLLTFVLGAAQAKDFTVDEKLSTVSFATIKLQYVVEPAIISDLSGSVSSSGDVLIQIPLNSISTGIQIRNERLNALFFNSSQFPTITVNAKLPSNIVSASNIATQVTLPADVTLFGQTQTVNFTVNIVKAGKLMSVSSSTPTIVNASSFGIPTDNLTALAATVGGIPISDKVPVSISLILKSS